MVDEVVREDASVVPPVETTGQADEKSIETPQQEVQEQQPTKVDLYKIDEFRRWQAQTNSTIQRLNEQLVQQRREADELRMSGMDDLEKTEFQYRRDIEERDNYIRSLQQQQQHQQMLMQRQADLEKLSKESGAPLEYLSTGEVYDDAVQLAIAWAKRHPAKADRDVVLDRNRVDVGGGEPSTPTTRRDTEMSELLRSGNSKDYIKKLLEG